MKNTFILIIALLFIPGGIADFSVIPISTDTNLSFYPEDSTPLKHFPLSHSDSMMYCTIFTVVHNNHIYFGNNEDYKLENTHLWTYPAQVITNYNQNREIYASIFLGFDNNSDADTDNADGYPQGGINEVGLCFDGNGLPLVEINAHNELPNPNYKFPIMNQVLWECATVNETIEWFQAHNLGTQFSGQLHVADSLGDAVVISGGSDKELVFTRLALNVNYSGYLVSTNFNLANTQNGYYPCPRYDRATEMLDSYLAAPSISKNNCRDILNAVHAEGLYHTIYSNIFDLTTKQIYLYHMYNFTNEVQLNFSDEVNRVSQLEDEDLDFNSGAKYDQIPIKSLFEQPPEGKNLAEEEKTLPWSPITFGIFFGISILAILSISYSHLKKTPIIS